MAMNPRLLRPLASGPAVVAKDASGNVIAPTTYTQGGVDFIAHIFNASGTLRFNRPLDVEYLVVGGGGGGGRNATNTNLSGGGGGAGGLLSNLGGSPLSVTPGEYTVTVGAGGAGGTSSANDGVDGQNSSFDSFAEAIGGGGGGAAGTTPPPNNGRSGGSGGGGGGGLIGSSSSGGAGTSGQGFSGGGKIVDTVGQSGASGGGAGGPGLDTTNAPMAGGPGLSYAISGSAVTYAAGGPSMQTSALTTPGADGTANTGNGGESTRGTATSIGGAGGSGIVIVRYKRNAGLSLNADAEDWLNRVYSNGGSVSAATLTAVNDFCSAIDAAGIRDRFYRLNLFAGTGLNAALVPLYRGPTYGGTTYGNATDTNNGPFVSADYVETGASGGLKGNGTSKYLATGFASNVFPSASDVHLSVSAADVETTGDVIPLGSFNGNVPNLYTMDFAQAGTSRRGTRLGSGTVIGEVSPSATSESHFLGVRRSTTDLETYRAGVSLATSTAAVTPAGSTREFFVYGLNSSGSAAAFTAARLRMYSIGNGMTGVQAADFSDAVDAFNTAMGRT